MTVKPPANSGEQNGVDAPKSVEIHTLTLPNCLQTCFFGLPTPKIGGGGATDSGGVGGLWSGLRWMRYDRAIYIPEGAYTLAHCTQQIRPKTHRANTRAEVCHSRGRCESNAHQSAAPNTSARG